MRCTIGRSSIGSASKRIKSTRSIEYRVPHLYCLSIVYLSFTGQDNEPAQREHSSPRWADTPRALEGRARFGQIRDFYMIPIHIFTHSREPQCELRFVFFSFSTGCWMGDLILNSRKEFFFLRWRRHERARETATRARARG